MDAPIPQRWPAVAVAVLAMAAAAVLGAWWFGLF
jgi:hypothetical protein